MDEVDQKIAIKNKQIEKVKKPDTQKHFPKTLRDLEKEREKNKAEKTYKQNVSNVNNVN